MHLYSQERKPPTLAAGSSSLQYLACADAMQIFLYVCGTFDEWLCEDKGNDISNNDEEFEYLKTLEFI